MPDAFDYEWLGRLLARPQEWTETDLASVRSIIATQKAALADLHPKDERGRRSQLALIDELERALAAHVEPRG